MKISNIPSDLDELLTRLGLKKPKMCFMNCYMAVMNTLSKENFDIHYVLGTVTTHDGHTFEHALIKRNDEYYDPTLEPQGRHSSSSYTIEKEFSPEEIVDLMVKTFEMSHIKDMLEGRQPHWPLVKVGPGKYEFEDA